VANGNVADRTREKVPDMTVSPFIVGSERSGTTLLRAMLDSHPAMAIPPESYFVVSFARRRPHYQRPGGFDLDRFAGDLIAYRWFKRWGVSGVQLREALASARPATYGDAVRCVYRLYAVNASKQRYGDKTPSYVLNIPFLSELLPETRFIHLVRDGRDVALALMEVEFGPTCLEEAAMHWKRAVTRGRRAGRRLGEHRYRELRYEDLVADPEGSLRGLCAFISLPFDECMLRYFERGPDLTASFELPIQHRHLLLPPTKGLRNWRTQMKRDDLMAFDVLGGHLLSELGYERHACRPSRGIAVRTRARQVAEESNRMARRIYKRTLVERRA
jgi:hypothetical protein